MSAPVAVLMPYYNYPTGLARTLESFRGETEPFDLYIVDDGSVPSLALNTAEYPFPIYIVRLIKNVGIEGALNAGLERILASGYEFIARMDAGDLWIPGRLKAQRDFLAAHPDHVVVGSWATAFNESGVDVFTSRYETDDAAIRNYIYLNSAFCHVATMFRASAARQAGHYPTIYPAAEDYAFFWDMLNYGKGANLPAVWAKYEITSAVASISYHQRRKQLRSRRSVQMDRFNAREILSWWGILRTTMLLYFPYKLLLKIKSWLWRR